MQNNLIKKIGCLLLLVAGCVSCKKYLAIKQDDALTIPATVNDLQLLMDSYSEINTYYSSAGEAGTDDFYVTPTNLLALPDISLRNYYTWQKDDIKQLEWDGMYKVVLYTNIVLEFSGKTAVAATEKATLAQVEGAAYFYRAYAFYSVAQIFAPPYQSGNTDNKLGVPLRLSSNFNIPSVRAGLQETYAQIVADFQRSIPLLPINGSSPNHPTKKAAYAALARTYLTMQQYDKAKLYADSSLQLYSTLIDYNTIDTTASNPLTGFNAEVLLPAQSFSSRLLNPNICKVDSVLYSLYDSSDLRKVIYFKSNNDGTYRFKGNYANNNGGYIFCGYATDEMLLIRAEANARLNNIPAAMNDLDTLLGARYRTGSFVPLTAATGTEALTMVLKERRKELCFRGLRWTDLRRLNLSPDTQLTLVRKVNDQTYTLQPNATGYTLQIPKVVITLSGMQQNP